MSGAVISKHGEAEGSMGMTVGDYDNEGDVDIVVVNKDGRPCSGTTVESTGAGS